MVQAFIRSWSGLPFRSRELLIAVFLPMSLVFLLLVGEGMVRWKQHREFGTGEVVERQNVSKQETWEYVGKRRRPVPYARMGKIVFSANGFRSPDLEMPKPNGLVRFGFFGSSTTLNFYVGDVQATWPAIAMRALSEAYPECRFDWFNAGVIGYSLAGIRGRFEDEGIAHQPDAALFLVSDVQSRARKQLSDRGMSLGVYKPSAFARLSVFWLKLEKNAESLRLQRLALRPDISVRIDIPEIQEQLATELDDLAQESIDRGVLPVFLEAAPLLRPEQPPALQASHAASRVLTMPGIYIEDVVEAMFASNDAAKAVAEKLDIPMIETVDGIPADPEYYVDSSHYTPQGSALFGRVVGQRLAEDDRIQGMVDRRGDGCWSVAARP